MDMMAPRMKPWGKHCFDQASCGSEFGAKGRNRTLDDWLRVAGTSRFESVKARKACDRYFARTTPNQLIYQE